MKPQLHPFRSLGLLVVVAASACGAEGTWPQWRGPQRTDVSQESGLLQQWPAGGPQRLWLSSNVGLGYSGPAIVGQRLLIMGARGQTEWLIALDVVSGDELWAAEIGPVFHNEWGDGPRGTPTVDGDRVYALGGQGALVCANLASGQVLWRRTMQELGGRTPEWGYSESVLVDADQLVCTPGGSKQRWGTATNTDTVDHHHANRLCHVYTDPFRNSHPHTHGNAYSSSDGEASA